MDHALEDNCDATGDLRLSLSSSYTYSVCLEQSPDNVDKAVLQVFFDEVLSYIKLVL